MAIKKTSRKSAASTPAPRQKQNGNSTKAALPATAVAKASKPAQAAKSTTTATAAKPTKVVKKAASLPRKSAAIGAKSTKRESLAIRTDEVALQPTSPSRQEIAARAAAIWREQGGAPFDNWIQAERELGA